MPGSSVERITETVLAVFRAHGRLIEWGDSFVAPLGLTSARWQMLGALALAGEALTTPRIADAMGVSRQGARKQLQRLAAEGLVVERPNPGHRRSPLYALTPRGESAYAAAEAQWREHAARLAGHLDESDLRAALRVLSLLETAHEPAVTAVGAGGS
ncbi:MarR family winged helix-turn-helix transcriptional regulator [Arhodomonas aquaeolei]|uniref:MarR family winged helix-turn-helix transcriptional regulator n=1 Tax=Arhodomonas aquaeolei TaxID=2369 RepID=UPI000378899E|nr:MarR family winged helix-turn-helix transcriptional regulator [Arhodomonas aquaeolei]MCS4505780.1 MarR family winged helix-turn-helix transcriptional regulator [Arhodomonas aquaeolei]